MNIKEWVVSWIRTSLVPPIAGFLLTFLTSHGITSIQSSWVFTAVTIILTGVWYGIFRGIEIASQNPTIKKIAGIFLGFPRAIPTVNTNPEV